MREKGRSVRFIHTADWQLGARPYYMSDSSIDQFSNARLDAIRRIGRLAERMQCDFVLVAGDVFASNQVDRRTVARGLNAMSAIPVQTFLLPGNHDPISPGSVYGSASFLRWKPANVTVLTERRALELTQSVELIPAPWYSKRPAADLVHEACSNLQSSKVLRIVVGHGSVDSISVDPNSPAVVKLGPLVHLLSEGILNYVALGDRHSVTRLAERVWYSGSPEPTDFGETSSGRVLVVDLAPDGSCDVEESEIGQWRFERHDFEVSEAADLSAIEAWLEHLPQKENTIVRLALKGTLPLRGKAMFDDILSNARDVFATIDHWEDSSLIVLPDDADTADLSMGGFVRTAWESLKTEAQSEDEPGRLARDTLALLYRLGHDLP